jgi:crotonobetainyl-CoA:carnitine CoA-transferase CaiB-like acyl-CoA transferase
VHVISPWDLFPCSDGYATVISGPFRNWLKGAEIFEEPKLLEPKYKHAIDRIKHRDEVETLIQPWLNSQKKENVFHKGQSKKLAFGFLADFEEVFSLPQHQSRQFFADIDHPVVGKQTYCGAPFKMSETPWENARTPLLGEHNQHVYGEMLKYSPEEIAALQETGVI